MLWQFIKIPSRGASDPKAGSQSQSDLGNWEGVRVESCSDQMAQTVKVLCAVSLITLDSMLRDRECY